MATGLAKKGVLGQTKDDKNGVMVAVSLSNNPQMFIYVQGLSLIGSFMCE